MLFGSEKVLKFKNKQYISGNHLVRLKKPREIKYTATQGKATVWL